MRAPADENNAYKHEPWPRKLEPFLINFLNHFSIRVAILKI